MVGFWYESHIKIDEVNCVLAYGYFSGNESFGCIKFIIVSLVFLVYLDMQTSQHPAWDLATKKPSLPHACAVVK